MGLSSTFRRFNSATKQPDEGGKVIFQQLKNLIRHVVPQPNPGKQTTEERPTFIHLRRHLIRSAGAILIVSGLTTCISAENSRKHSRVSSEPSLNLLENLPDLECGFAALERATVGQDAPRTPANDAKKRAVLQHNF